MSLLQWNCNGLKHKLNELKILCQQLNPIAIAVQETRLRDSDTVNIPTFNIYKKNSNHIRASRGVALLVNSSIKQEEIVLQCNLQVVACSIYIPMKISLISIYLPGEEQINKQQIRNLIQQVHPPVVIMGDFNGHSESWGSSHRDTRGKIYEDLIDELNLIVLNNGSATHFSTAYQSFSARPSPQRSLSDNLRTCQASKRTTANTQKMEAGISGLDQLQR